MALEAYFDGSADGGDWSVNGTLITLAGCAAEDEALG